MTAQWWMAIAAAVLIVTALVLAKVDAVCEAKAKRDRERWENDAIDLTGGAR